MECYGLNREQSLSCVWLERFAKVEAIVASGSGQVSNPGARRLY